MCLEVVELGESKDGERKGGLQEEMLKAEGVLMG